MLLWRPVVHLYAVCWNEAHMLPYFFRNYEPWVQRFVLFDNGSTDGTKALLSGKPNVEVRPFPWSDPSSFVLSQRRLQNTCSRESRGVADWVVVTAIDEHLYHPDMEGFLRRCVRDGVTCIPALGYEMVTSHFPAPDAHLARDHRRGAPSRMLNKLRLFNPDQVKPRIAIGGHGAKPTGHVVYPPRDELLLLHYKHLGVEYLVQRNALLDTGLRAGDRAKRFGHHYALNRAQIEANVDSLMRNAIDLDDPRHVPWRDHPSPRFWRSAEQLSRPSGRKVRPFRAFRKAARHFGVFVRGLNLLPPAADRGYMICATPRSGSNYLSQLLASTGVLGNPREYFNAPGRRHYDDPDYPESPEQQVRQILTTGRTPNGIYAVKVHPFQLATLPRNIDPRRDLPHLHYVLLQRRDLIGQAISWSRAQQTGQLRATDRSQQDCQYDLDHIRKSLRFLLDQRNKWKRLLRRTKTKPMVLEYESLLRDPQSTVNRVAALLRISESAGINPDLVIVTIQRDEISDEWRARFLADTGDEFRHLL